MGLALYTARALRRFARRRDGATAVEFGLVAVPFFVLLVAMGEVSIMSMAQTNLDFAVNDMARRIRTGQVQTEGLTAEAAAAEICADMNTMIRVDCEGNLFLDVDTYENFNDVSNPSPVSNGAVDEQQVSFEPGAPGEIVLIRGLYRWRVVTPLVGAIFANVGAHDRLMVSSVLVRNEPFPANEED